MHLYLYNRCVPCIQLYVYTRWGKEEVGKEWHGAFPECGPLAKDSAAILKGSQQNECTVYVPCNLFPPVAENCARLADNFCQYLATVTSVANDMVWLTLFSVSQLASRVGVGQGEWGNRPPYNYTTWLRCLEQRGGVAFPPLACILRAYPYLYLYLYST